jgi:hypothetical protein
LGDSGDDDAHEWLSFSSADECSLPNERGDSRFNFPNTEYKLKVKFFQKDQNGDGNFGGCKIRKLNIFN